MESRICGIPKTEKAIKAYHFFESSYFKVEGMDTRADSTFLEEPHFKLHSIYTQKL